MRFPTLGSWMERLAARSPSDTALIVGERRWTYAELVGAVRATAREFDRRGVRAGSRVAFHGKNHPAALISLFASSVLGGVWVPIHPSRPDDEVSAVLDDAGPSVLVRAEPDTHPSSGVPELEATELEALPPSSEVPRAADVDLDELAILAYTSGTTGEPKGVMLTQGNVLWNVVQMLAACAFTPNDVSIAHAPFTRMGGLGVTVLPTLFVGGTVVVPPTADGASALDTIDRSRVTVLFANPDLLEGMVRAPGWGAAALSSVRTGVVGGGLVPEPLLRTYLERGVLLRHGYGLTEAAPVVSLLDERDAVSRADSVGRPLPFVEVETRQADGTPCRPDEIGRWWIRGPNVCAGYWRRPPVHDPDGWFPTGDAGSIDADGYLTFADRASSAMMIDGATVYPATIERALYGAPGIVDAAAVQVEGAVIVAVVADVTFDLARVTATLAEALPPQAVPRQLRVVPAIPRNAAGKVRREELHALLASAATA